MSLSECNSDNLDDTFQEKGSHGSHSFPVAIYDDILEVSEVQWHWHVEFELIKVTSGEGIFSCNGKNVILKAGQGMFINCGNLHGCKTTSANHCQLHSIVFHPRFISGGNDSILWVKYVQPLSENKCFNSCILDKDNSQDKIILSLIDNAWKNMQLEKDGFEFKVRDQLSQIIFHLCQKMKENESTKDSGDIKKISRLKTMMEFIQLNYQEDINVADISNSAMVSESECNRCFKSLLNTTPVKYLNSLRLQKACELLISTPHLSASKVAEMCGFMDNSYFGKIFKKEMGMTPLEYRKAAGTKG